MEVELDLSSFANLRVLIPERLAFISGRPSQIESLRKRVQGYPVRVVSSELHRQYFPLAADFGPVNIAVVTRFCISFDRRMARDDGILLIYCIQESFQDRANASFLLAAFAMLCHGFTPKEAAEPFTSPNTPFKLQTFRDATFLTPTYGLTLLNCLRSIQKAVQHGWYDWKTFDADEYWALDNPQTGDIHQICPKFVAMKGPLEYDSKYLEGSEIALPPNVYTPILHRLDVTCLIRLNNPDTYDRDDFVCSGIAHYDLYFDDCTAPPDDIVERFLDICDREGRVAVHCRAGLGRTGTLTGAWLMKHAGFGADEAIGWLRIVRPGSVIGPQQQYLKELEGRGWRGNAPVPDPNSGLSIPPSTDTSDALAAQVTAGMRARGAAKAAFAAEAAAAAAAAYSAPSSTCGLGADGPSAAWPVPAGLRWSPPTVRLH